MVLEIPTIAILGGTGKEGTGLALRWAATGYKVIIGSRKLEKAQIAAQHVNNLVGKRTVIGLENLDAANQADICVLTVVHSAHLQVLESLKDVLADKILIDTTSRVDYRNPRPPLPPSAAQEAQNLLGPRISVVAAFQNVPAISLTKNIGENIEVDILVCSDDVSAAEKVIELAKSAGMRGFYAGNLDNAIIVEGLTSILIDLNHHYRVKNASIKITGIAP